MQERLSELGEFGFIRKVTAGVAAPDTIVEGIGDDCAVVRAGETLLLLTCDAAVEEVHFSFSLASPEEAGWRVAAAAISDIAAMGGKPLCMTVAMALPAETPVAIAEALFQGICAAAAAHDTAVAGGDTTASRSGIFLDCAVTGVPVTRPVLRHGARHGDVLVITGWPGQSAAGLRALQRDAPGARAAYPTLTAAHLRPRARLAEGQWLAAQPEVRAMLDVSDGLLQDAGHLCAASGLGVNIDPARTPLSGTLLASAHAHGWQALELALRGGEDYELLAALQPDAAPRICAAFERQFNLPLTVLGDLSRDWQGVRLAGAPAASGGFDHFLAHGAT